MAKCVLASLAIAVIALAAGQGVPSSPHLTFEQRGAFLLTNRNVQSTLGLGRSQIGAISAAVASHGQKQQALLSAEKLQDAAVAAEDRAFANRLLVVLDLAQRKQLAALALREVGPEALSDKDIAAAVGLSATQKKSVANVLADYAKKAEAYDSMLARGLARVKEPKDSSEMDAYNLRVEKVVRSYDAEKQKLAAAKKETESKLLALLSSAQRAKWNAMTKA